MQNDVNDSHPGISNAFSSTTNANRWGSTMQGGNSGISPPTTPPGFPKPKFSGASSPRYPRSPPLMSPGGRSTSSTYGREGCFAHVRMTAGAKLSRFFKRLVNFRHMDFEFAFWQMLFLLVSPQKVYRNFMYRKS